MKRLMTADNIRQFILIKRVRDFIINISNDEQLDENMVEMDDIIHDVKRLVQIAEYDGSPLNLGILDADNIEAANEIKYEDYDETNYNY